MSQQADGIRVLVTAASEHGATAGIAHAIATEMERHGLIATTVRPADVSSVDSYDAVIIGSAVYSGHWLEAATDFVTRFREPLTTMPVWLFSSGPVGKPSGKLARSMGREAAEVAQIREATHARGHQIFGGKLDRAALSRPQRVAMVFFPGLTGDFRDWDQITSWAAGVAAALEATPARHQAPDSGTGPQGPSP